MSFVVERIIDVALGILWWYMKKNKLTVRLALRRGTFGGFSVIYFFLHTIWCVLVSFNLIPFINVHSGLNRDLFDTIMFLYYFCFIWFQEDFLIGTCFLSPIYLVGAYFNDYAHVMLGWHPNGYYRYAFHVGIVLTNVVGSYMRNLETAQMVVKQIQI